MRTITGLMAPIYPECGEISALDIVLLLGRKPRFGDNGNQEFTVLHHSTLVGIVWIVAGFPKEELIYANCHDWHEYITGDFPSPLKNLNPEIKKAIQNLEKMLDTKIYKFMGIDPPNEETKKRVKFCDNVSLIIESLLTGPPNCGTLEEIKEHFSDPKMWEIIYKIVPNIEELIKNKTSSPF